MLTNLSLELSAKKYTRRRKAVGSLDYNLAYSPLVPLSKRALHYCEEDILTLYEIIKWFKTDIVGTSVTRDRSIYGHAFCGFGR